MAEKIIRGYIAKIADYNVFDSIVTIVSDDDQILGCFAPGTKKILSKNARHLIVGNYNENTLFLARPNKLSKLKKTVCIKPIHWQYQQWKTFQIINHYLSHLNGHVLGSSLMYKQTIKLMSKNNYSDNYLALHTLIQIIRHLGIHFHFQNCVYCNSTKNIKTISFEKSGFICQKCYEESKKKIQLFSPDILREIYFLFQYNQPNQELATKDQTFQSLLRKFIWLIDKYGGINMSSLATTFGNP